MNILTDRLPTSLTINGQDYKIKSDFRTALKIILAFEDAELAGVEKSILFYDLLYIDKPEDVMEALHQGTWFLNGGKDEENESDGPRVFSWEKDSNLIFAAYQQTHGIDLSEADLHWWKFLALFMDLGSETAFCSLVGLRRRVKTGKATKEEKQMAREMGSLFIVPDIDDRTPDEIEAEREFMKMINAGRKQ
jgi:hypothetical protein